MEKSSAEIMAKFLQLIPKDTGLELPPYLYL
jgi:hypothetical protein